MRTIWKWALDVQDVCTIRMPMSASLLTVAVQDGAPCIWALVDPAQPSRERRIRIYGTGHSINEPGRYIGTFQLLGGTLVFHVFDGGEVLS